MSRILGITGNIACGKTVVGQMLLELGAEKYIDADALVHRLYLSGQPIAREVARAFGPGIMASDGSVDRKALGELVFRDAAAMHRLEAIVHPAVGAAIMGELETVSPGGIIVIDAVKLLEGGSAALCHSKWLIICPESQELTRLMARNGLSEQEARARLQAQPSVESRLLLVDEVIDNGGTLEETRRQVEAAFRRFCERFPAE
ncbi:MAG TPA: dephospho-CoA kinase [Ktedonobacteraceae bacterium]|nr:dephospho-CoA kinase [Ktedonobacteraceae bacterium]